jgi:hypothetical protein
MPSKHYLTNPFLAFITSKTTSPYQVEDALYEITADQLLELRELILNLKRQQGFGWIGKFFSDKGMRSVASKQKTAETFITQKFLPEKATRPNLRKHAEVLAHGAYLALKLYKKKIGGSEQARGIGQAKEETHLNKMSKTKRKATTTRGDQKRRNKSTPSNASSSTSQLDSDSDLDIASPSKTRDNDSNYGDDDDSDLEAERLLIEKPLQKKKPRLSTNIQHHISRENDYGSDDTDDED